MFDDSYIHSAICSKKSSSSRVVLSIDIWHPNLPARETRVICQEFSMGRNGKHFDLIDHQLLVHRTHPPYCKYNGPFLNQLTMRINYDYFANIFILGAARVGKTSFAKRFNDRSYGGPNVITITKPFVRNSICKLGKTIRLQIWHNEEQSPEAADGILIMFDTTNACSFQEVDGFMTSYSEQLLPRNNPAIGEHNQRYKPVILLVGTKADLVSERQVDRQQAIEKAEQYGMAYCETSSKNGYGVDNVFDKFLSLWINHLADISAITAIEHQLMQIPEAAQVLMQSASVKSAQKKCVIS